ncbi:hypothetical protein NIES3974_03580 [Calothrix sp. NIES-3974]|nr:hypothetical protein NIES3974_03580 [Calothrix sp. NIES-3974]
MTLRTLCKAVLTKMMGLLGVHRWDDFAGISYFLLPTPQITSNPSQTKTHVRVKSKA